MIHLAGRSSDVLIDVSTGTSTIAYWGAPLAAVADTDSITDAVEIKGGVQTVITLVVEIEG